MVSALGMDQKFSPEGINPRELYAGPLLKMDRIASASNSPAPHAQVLLDFFPTAQDFRFSHACASLSCARR